VFVAGRTATKELISFLEDKSLRLPEIVQQLNELWSKPEERISKIAQDDQLLMKELKQEEYQDEMDLEEANNAKDVNDNASEYSAITKYSLQSFRSGAKSLVSSHSLASKHSIISGNNSSVTILSQLTDRSSSAVRGGNDDEKDSAFAIQGLEHSLLSRGKVNEYEGMNTLSGELKPRKAKRIEKQKQKGTYYDRQEAEAEVNDAEGNAKQRNTKEAIQKRKERHAQKRAEQPKDSFELKKENTLCGDLLSYMQLKPLLNMIMELKQMLFMSSTSSSAQISSSDRLLLMELMEKEQQFIEMIQKQSLIYAPTYPLVWLLKKNLKNVLYFQNYQFSFNKKIFKNLQLLKTMNLSQYNLLLSSGISQTLGINLNNNENQPVPTTELASAVMPGTAENSVYQLLMMLNILTPEELNEFHMLQSKNWWNSCYEGIQMYYQSSKMIHFQS
jgi:hypothetical protein